MEDQFSLFRDGLIMWSGCLIENFSQLNNKIRFLQNTFDTLIPLLPKNLRIVAVDPPGHGLSDPFPPDIAYNFM